MPLCSCGVIPVAAALRRDGAGKGATTAFLASTPQTGVDSIFATWGMLGGLFALVRVVAAFVSGLVSGVLVDAFDKKEAAPDAAPVSPRTDRKPGLRAAVREVLQYGFVTMPSDIGRSLLVGLAVAALISALIPADVLSGWIGGGALGFLLITLLAVPMYVCSTGSIPVALALIHVGLSPGAALVFLIAGPATNAATISTLWKIVGRRSVLLYLASIIGTAWLFGFLFNAVLADAVCEAVCEHAMASSWGGHLWALALLAVLANALRPRSHTHETENTPAPDSEVDAVRYRIRGMHCTHCAEQIRRTALTIPGIQELEVDHASGRAVLHGSRYDEALLFSEVQKLGYEIAREFSHK